MDQDTQGNEMSFELLKNPQQIADEAALRAKEMVAKSMVPELPNRHAEKKQAPEVPPKRLSLKKSFDEVPRSNGNGNGHDEVPIPIPQRNQFKKPPPPVPMKPSSAQNSPMLKEKLSHVNVTVQPQQQMFYQPPQNMFHERVSQSPQLTAKNQNIVNILNSPLFQQRANQYRMQQQQQQQQSQVIRQQQIKADEDFGSEDALRGIERGLKNMERAMKEQMTMRTMDFTDGNAKSNGNGIPFNPIEFKRSLGGGSINSLDGSQTMRMMGSMRLNFDNQPWNQRGMERNISMDQMRLEMLQGNNNFGAMKGMHPVDFAQQPKHNIYRSLDRTLPLELQFSRHRQMQQQQQQQNQQQQQQEFDFIRQGVSQIMNQQQQRQGASREDANLRRRSSHDETQFIMQQQKQQQTGNQIDNNTAGGMQNNVNEKLFISPLIFVYFRICSTFSLLKSFFCCVQFRTQNTQES